MAGNQTNVAMCEKSRWIHHSYRQPLISAYCDKNVKLSVQTFQGGITGYNYPTSVFTLGGFFILKSFNHDESENRGVKAKVF